MTKAPAPPFDTIDTALAALSAKHPRKIDLSLERLALVLSRLENPQERCPPIIHVAGTNGKGSTIAYMRAILEAAGKAVHVYTSPHLVHFRERIRLNGSLIADGVLLDVLARVHAAAGSDPITFFEATTAAAFLAFSEAPADVLLLEVGLGGRFDATNIIARSDVGVVTPVSFDHMEFLGTDLLKIAGEKAGIARRDVPLIINQPDKDVRKAIERDARKVGAHPIIAGHHYSFTAYDQGFEYKDARGTLTLPAPAMLGEFQCDNAALAVAALRHQSVWDVPAAAYTAGIRWAQWPARLQRLDGGKLAAMLPKGSKLWLDGGHNPAAGAQVGKFIKERVPPETPVHLIVGMLENKDLAGYLAAFKGLLAGLWALPIEGHGHHAPAALAAFGQELGTSGHIAGPDVTHALGRIAQQAGEAQPPQVFIVGSLYLAGSVLALNETPPT